jgi:MFS transporter, DHA1 family, multidrug resistance protein
MSRPTGVAMPAPWSITGLSTFVASLIALPSLSIDVVMPGLAAMRAETGASLSQSGLVLTLFMAGIATGQAFLGPLSDRIGRRPVLLGGLTIYVISGAGCALADSPALLLELRALQGVGAGAGTVLALAVVRDLLEGDVARIVRSYATAAFNVIPILAPPFGALLLAASGWHAAHAVPATLGAALLLWIALRFGETRPAPDRGVASGHNLRAELLRRRFVACVALNAASYAALMSYIAGSSLALMDGMGLSAQVYALAFAGGSVALMLGAWTNGRMARRGVPGPLMLAAGLAIGTASSVSLALLPVRPDATSGLLAALSILSRGITAPSAQQAALEPFPTLAGAAAAVVSLAQMLGGVCATLAVVPLYQAFGPQGVAYAMAGSSLAALGIWAWAKPG